MTRSELIKELSLKFPALTLGDVTAATAVILSTLSETIARGDRVEIRGFGSFSTHIRPPRIARNPKTGAPVEVPAKPTPHFKPGLELRELVNKTFPSQAEPAYGRVAPIKNNLVGNSNSKQSARCAIPVV